jgi:hypothetical protein
MIISWALAQLSTGVSHGKCQSCGAFPGSVIIEDSLQCVAFGWVEIYFLLKYFGVLCDLVLDYFSRNIDIGVYSTNEVRLGYL